MFEVIEHTADIGLRIVADSVNELFIDAGRGFASLLVENPETVASREIVRIDIEADDLPNLMHDWLAEILFIFETRGLVLVNFEPEVIGTRVRAMAYGELFDPVRHYRYLTIKAITYHELTAERRADGWHGKVIVDI